MLYYTPFLLSGFSWSPDSLWHGGMASYISEILSGKDIPLSSYARSYPLSFVTTYCVEQILGVDVFTYTLYIYPLANIITVTALTYVFVARILNPKIAFASTLIAASALHYFEPHVSPLSLGTIIVLASFILITMESRLARALSYFLILTLTLTHPISPVSLGIFLSIIVLFDKCHGRFYPSKLDFYNLEARQQPLLVLLFLTIVWFLWTVFQAILVYTGVRNAVLNVFNLKFFERLIYVAEWTAGGKSFIYEDILKLNLIVYIIFLFVVSSLVLSNFINILKAWRKSLSLDYISYMKFMLAFTSIIYAVFGYALFLASGERFLLGRGLFYFILFGSICISMFCFINAGKEKTYKYLLISGLFVILIFFLITSFPIIAYSKEAYNSFTPSAGSGLSFLSKNVCLCRYSISMGADQQLASYTNISNGLIIFKFPPNTNVIQPNFIALRINSYYSISMRYDLSFQNNSFIILKNSLERDVNYNKIYSNSMLFEIFANTR
jgi:hypothetical protein